MGRLMARASVWVALTLILALLSIAQTAWAGSLGFRLVSHETPPELYAGHAVSVRVVLQNTGEDPWSDAAGDRLAYHWRSAEGEMLVRDGLRTKLPTSVARGEKLTLDARLEPPTEPGTYQLEWRMVRENVHWYPRPHDGESTRITVVVGGAPFEWSVLGLDVDPLMEARGEGTLRARVRNDGAATWRSADEDFVAYHWWDADGRLAEYDGLRGPFSGDVAPGETVDVVSPIRAPRSAGVYRLELEPLRERVRWFGPPRSGEDLSAPVRVSTPELAWGLLSEDTPRELPAGGAVDVHLSIANTGYGDWGERDRLSYHWRDASGRQVGEGDRTLLPDLIAPGESVQLTARLFAPDEPGEYRLAWEMVREDVQWYGGSTVAASAPVAVTVGRPELAWSLLEMDELPSIWVNDRTEVRVTIRNDGAEAWTDEAGDRLAYHWLDEAGEMVTFDGRRTKLPHPVGPGETVELLARLRGPRAAGSYELVFEMVREEVRWYGPPQAGVEAGTQAVSVRWFSGTLQLTLALATLVLLFGVRRPTMRRGGWVADAVEAMPIVWTWASVALIGVSFAELSGLGFWKGGLTYTLSGAALACLPPLALRGRARVWAAAVIVLGLNALALADLVYMHFYGSIVPLTALMAAHHLAEVHSSVVSLFEPSYLWLGPAPLALLVLALGWPRRIGASSGRRSLLIWGTATLACALAATPAVLRLHAAMTTELGVRVFSEQNNAARLGVLNAHLFDFARTFREMQQRVATPQERDEVETWFDHRAAQVAADEPEGFGHSRGKNLLLIQVESAQTFIVGASVDGQEITPFLNGLRGRALYYPQLVDQTAQGKTSDGEYAVLSSQHPLRAGALCFLRADNHFVTLAHVLGAAGYSTFSAHPFKRGFWNRAVLHPRYGFERSMFRRELGPGPEIGWGLADGPFFERIVGELQELPKPFFAFLITLSLHHPYDSFPDSFKVLDLGDLEGTRLGNYLHGMNYFDRSLEKLFADLEAAGLLGDTVVALYGDHDARLELDDAVLGVANVERWSPSVFHRLERVPFFVALPGDGPTGVVASLGGQVDVGPTLLHYLGVERPRAFSGRALTPDGTDGFAAYPDGSAFADDRFLITRGYDIPRGGACFDARGGTARPRADCDDIESRARDELSLSRAVLDLDLHRMLAAPALVDWIEAREQD